MTAERDDMALRYNVEVTLHEFDALDTDGFAGFIDGLPAGWDRALSRAAGLLGGWDGMNHHSQFQCVSFVNAVSAGPIRTLAAAGISDFRSMLKQVEERTPLRRNVTIDEVGNAAAFLCSDLASGITGDVLYVDTGYHILGLG